MKIMVTRQRKTRDGIFGILTLEGDPFTCYTVENLGLAIPIGTFDVSFDYSARFNRTMPHIWVPERDELAKARGQANAGIRIHWANYPSQLEGCIAVGDKQEPNAVDDSVATFNQLYTKIYGKQDVQIEIKENYEQRA